MRKYYIKLVVLLIIFSLGLSACGRVSDDASDITNTEQPTQTPSPSQSVDPSPIPSIPNELGHIDMSIFIELDWPKYTASYSPKITAFPLIGGWGRRGYILSGDIVFVNERLERIELPFEPLGYQVVVANKHTQNEENVAFALKKEQNIGNLDIYVLMLADGTVPLGIDGDYIYLYNQGDEFFIFPMLGSSIVTCRLETDAEGHLQALFGLYDLEKRRELLPREYISIHVHHGGAYEAIAQDGMGHLIDASGNYLYTFGERFAYNTNSLKDGGIIFDLREQLLYRVTEWPIEGKYRRFYRWNGLTIGEISETRRVSESFPFSYTELHIADADGRILHKTESGSFNLGSLYNSIPLADGYITVLTASGFEVIDRNGVVNLFPYDPTLISNVDFFSDDEFVYFLPESPRDNPYYTLDREGNIQPSNRYRFEWYDPIVYNHQTSSYSIRDATGQIVFESDDFLWNLGDLVLAFTMDFENYGAQPLVPRSVYAMDGTLLLDGVYAFTNNIVGPSGGVFVYLDSETCVLLYPDGRTVPVSSAPVVEWVERVWEYEGGY